MPHSTLLEVLTKAATYLHEKSVPNARLDAELLLAEVLKCKRLDLYLQFDRPLSETELAGYRGFIRRRGQREPLQHIVGEVQFRELRLKTDKRALIPRPETELLLDILKKNLPSLEHPRILDIGVGTGAIALSILRELPHCQVFGSDISPECLELTRENAITNVVSVPELFLGNLFDPIPADLRWDVVVSNPPYVAASEFSELQPEVRDFDPTLALIGGQDGWETPLNLLTKAFLHIKSEGILLMEIDPRQFSLLKERALFQGWRRVEGNPDYQQINRFILLSR